MRAVGKALQCGFARVTARRDGDEIVVGRAARGTELVDACREEHRQALERHVLERARGAVPQLKHVHAVGNLLDGGDFGRVEVVGVDGAHEGLELLVGEVHAEAAVDCSRAMRVGKLAQRDNLVERHRGNHLGDEQASTGRDALDHSLAELERLGHVATRIYIADFHCSSKNRRTRRHVARRVDGTICVTLRACA